jgi:hypothetical protein
MRYDYNSSDGNYSEDTEIDYERCFCCSEHYDKDEMIFDSGALEYLSNHCLKSGRAGRYLMNHCEYSLLDVNQLIEKIK